MIEPNAICQEEQDWLRTEQDQQNWLRAEQDQQDCLRAEQGDSFTRCRARTRSVAGHYKIPNSMRPSEQLMVEDQSSTPLRQMLAIGSPPKAMTNIGAEIDDPQSNTVVRLCLYHIRYSAEIL